MKKAAQIACEARDEFWNQLSDSEKGKKNLSALMNILSVECVFQKMTADDA